ncbi:phosphatidylinositol mannoside acyltransferase [Geodermatophilus ruber]|uniref:KDO2-lipid IV(A) lauroyltransferase n=1 Tax=Geodermatophilus ruber TaxID=504800 RepID=A0A1I4FGX2_9ACTN|nr:phosphatidylinositol mannoside acyltransferase [Geodermatophilus ruber]SFL17215.1 KDO2-lipid IV(A) lauroyltransferase [Geodermatophilus ruber]
MSGALGGGVPEPGAGPGGAVELRPVPGRPSPGARASARLTDLGYAAGWGAVKLLPEPVVRAAFDAAGRWAAGRDGRGVRQLRANLRVVTGGRLGEAELDALTGRAMRSYARYWQEAFRLPRLSSGRIVAGSEMLGREHLEKARGEGRGLVFALPHSGNWDAAGVWFVDWLDGPFMTVAERLRPESLYRRFLDYRESLGMRVVPLTGGPRPSSAVLGEWLAAGGSVCLLVDRDLGHGGIPVDFFGRPATMPGGPALLAARTGAALHPAVCSFTDRGWRLDVRREVPVDGPGRLRDRVAAAMQGVADAFTDGIARHPEDWHMLGRVWADVPPDPARGDRSR